MKYTRYDLKQRSDGKTFILTVVFILMFAFFFATVIFKIFVGNSNSKNQANNMSDTQVSNQNKKGSQNSNAVQNDEKLGKFIAVQGGIYKDKNNAEQEKNLLKQYGIPFSITEQDKTRVLLGIYNEETGKNIVTSLTEQKVDNSKMMFSVDEDSTCNTQIVELVNAYIQVLNKMSEKNVEAVQTSELKKWSISLEKVKDGKNLNALNEIKSYINKLPDKISKDKVEGSYIYVYNFLNKVGKK